jgi:hypothetical protein
MARTPSRKSGIEIPDLSDVNDEGGGFKIPEGDYLMECTAVQSHESKDSGNPGLKWTFTGQEGKAKDKIFYMYTSFSEGALWKVKRTLKHLQVEIPDSAFEIEPDDVVGKQIIGVVTDSEYERRITSKLTDTQEIDAEPEAKDEKPSKTPAKTTTTAKDRKPTVTFTVQELTDMEEDELAEVNGKYKLGVDLDEYKTKRKQTAALSAALEEKGMLKN